MIDSSVLKNDEKAIFTLRSLYRKYGYLQYKMSKFEEYDLYAHNKDFLVGDRVITFTDVGGKLMALKPDVTLSIIKNYRESDGGTQRVYYNENVYRVSESAHEFREIMQAGLECIGDIGLYDICEVTGLAAKSLATISNRYVLDISHMGLVSGMTDEIDTDAETKRTIAKLIGEKNTHEIRALCAEKNIPDGICEKLVTLVGTYGDAKTVLPVLSDICMNEKMRKAIAELGSVCDRLCEDEGLCSSIRIDASVINDMNYYSGIVFRGFVDGIPTGVLSGGEYDNLMRKMGKTGGAIGFAVYLNLLEHIQRESGEADYDVDTVMLYGDGCDMSGLARKVDDLRNKGYSVSVQKEVPAKLKYRQLCRYSDKGAEVLENND